VNAYQSGLVRPMNAYQAALIGSAKEQTTVERSIHDDRSFDRPVVVDLAPFDVFISLSTWSPAMTRLRIVGFVLEEKEIPARNRKERRYPPKRLLRIAEGIDCCIHADCIAGRLERGGPEMGRICRLLPLAERNVTSPSGVAPLALTGWRSSSP
jgi:hypothetical protein